MEKKNKIVITCLILIIILVLIAGYFMTKNENSKQTDNVKLSKKEALCQSIIDYLIKEDEGLNTDAKYIALDFESFTPSGNPLTQEEIDNISKYVEEKYELEVKKASFQDLRNQGLYEEEKGQIDGILFRVNNIIKFEENEVQLEAEKYRGNLGAIFVSATIKYENDSWNMTINNMAIS